MIRCWFYHEGCVANGRCAVSQNLSKRWPLLVLCSFFYATFSFIILFILSPDGFLPLRTFAPSRSSIEQLGLVALAAGVCTVAIGIWNAREANLASYLGGSDSIRVHPLRPSTGWALTLVSARS